MTCGDARQAKALLLRSRQVNARPKHALPIRDWLYASSKIPTVEEETDTVRRLRTERARARRRVGEPSPGTCCGRPARTTTKQRYTIYNCLRRIHPKNKREQGTGDDQTAWARSGGPRVSNPRTTAANLKHPHCSASWPNLRDDNMERVGHLASVRHRALLPTSPRASGSTRNARVSRGSLTRIEGQVCDDDHHHLIGP